jgi:low affinity Fe/Cu permease
LRPGRSATEGDSIVNKWFAKFAGKASNLTGSSWAFLSAVVIIIVWAVTGPLFNFSDTWQLIINTFTTLVTFLMVFLIQNTQNRDAKALHLKLDEVIHALAEAHNEIMGVEDRPDEDLRDLIQLYQELAQRKGSRRDMERLLREILARTDGDTEPKEAIQVTPGAPEEARDPGRTASGVARKGAQP